MLALVAFLVSLLVSCVPSLACAPPAERTVYRIEHETFGNIGRQVLTFACRGDRLVVDTSVSVAVRVLFVTLYRHEAHYREVWQGDRLVGFESHTDDNGRALEVSARAVGGRVIIDGPKGRSEAPSTVVPDHPWNRDLIDRTLLFDPIDGTVRQVAVVDAGEAPIQVEGRRIMAHRYRVSGDLELESWYDGTGAWVKWRMQHERGAVTMTRELPSVVADAGRRDVARPATATPHGEMRGASPGAGV
jgi:Family of unknown function (DUF6134)